jgi:hypothetical protein
MRAIGVERAGDAEARAWAVVGAAHAELEAEAGAGPRDTLAGRGRAVAGRGRAAAGCGGAAAGRGGAAAGCGGAAAGRGGAAAGRGGAAIWVRRHARRWLAVVLVALVGGALALGPAGAKVGDWLGRTFAPPAGRELPADGRMLVSDSTGAWIVRRDLSTRWLGAWATVSWSPRGLFVLATRRNLLAALDPQGQVRWTLARPHVSHAVWSRGDGYRVAYRSGSQLRIVAGDGSGDRALAHATMPVTPAWRPGPPSRHVLAYATRGGGVVVRDVDADAAGTRPAPGAAAAAGSPPARQRPRPLAVPVRRGAPVRALAWAGPDRLLVVRREAVELRGLDGRRLTRIATPYGGRYTGLAVAPDGRRAALVRLDRTRGESELWTVRLDRPRARMRLRFAGAGGFGAVSISPDGRWAAVAWPAGDRWVFATTTGARRLTAIGSLRRRLDPGARARATGPAVGESFGVTGWAP